MALRLPASRRMPLDNDWKIEVDLTIDNEPLAGNPTVFGLVSETPDGLEIAAAVKVPLVRAPLPASQKTWKGAIPGASITAVLAAYVDPVSKKSDKLWEIVTVSGSALRAARWIRVYDDRII